MVICGPESRPSLNTESVKTLASGLLVSVTSEIQTSKLPSLLFGCRRLDGLRHPPKHLFLGSKYLQTLLPLPEHPNRPYGQLLHMPLQLCLGSTMLALPLRSLPSSHQKVLPASPQLLKLTLTMTIIKA